MTKFRKVLLLIATTAAIGGGLMTLGSSKAEADLFTQCPIQRGSTRFFDFGTNRCGYVFGDNGFWGDLPGNWNDRADQFGNDGNTHNNCLYEHIACGGLAVHLPRGIAITWPNIVSANRWTTASTCSRARC